MRYIKDKICVDHKNKNGLDNRKKNLRLCTKQQNSFSRKPHKYKNRTSRYKGVSKSGDGWVVRIMKDGKSHYIGSTKNEKEAAVMYNVTARELFGEFAQVNVLFAVL